MTPKAPVNPAQPGSTDLEMVLRDAEQFLAKTSAAVHPDLAPRTMMRYLTQYRHQLHAIVAITRHQQGQTIGHNA